jgi:hypothetical protein
MHRKSLFLLESFFLYGQFSSNGGVSFRIIGRNSIFLSLTEDASPSIFHIASSSVNVRGEWEEYIMKRIICKITVLIRKSSYLSIRIDVWIRNNIEYGMLFKV